MIIYEKTGRPDRENYPTDGSGSHRQGHFRPLEVEWAARGSYRGLADPLPSLNLGRNTLINFNKISMSKHFARRGGSEQSLSQPF